MARPDGVRVWRRAPQRDNSAGQAGGATRTARRNRSFLAGATEEATPVEPALDAYELFAHMRRAGCEDAERRAVLLLIVHRSIPRVAREMGLPKARVLRLLRSARDRLGRWRGIGGGRLSSGEILGVFADEVSRRGYLGEHHCPPGEEECRVTGYCTRRWYVRREVGPI